MNFIVMKLDHLISFETLSFFLITMSTKLMIFNIGEATLGGVRSRQFTTRRRRPRAKASERRSLDEGHAHRCGGRPPSCIIAKGPKWRYKDGRKLNGRGVADSLGEGPVPKPWSKASSGDGSGSMLGPACQSSCNPMRILYIWYYLKAHGIFYIWGSYGTF